MKVEDRIQMEWEAENDRIIDAMAEEEEIEIEPDFEGMLETMEMNESY